MIELVQMGESGDNQSERKIYQKKEYKEPLRGGVELSKVGDRIFLDVGNAGLRVDINRASSHNTLEVHFSPEGRFSAATTTRQKVRNIRLFGFALYELIQWLRNNPEFLGDIGEAQIAGATNETLAEFVTKIFAESDSPIISERGQNAESSENNILKFKLKTLAEIPQDSPLFYKLKRMHDSCQDMILNKVVYVPPYKSN